MQLQLEPAPILTFNLTAGSEFEVMELEFPDQTVLPNSRQY